MLGFDLQWINLFFRGLKISFITIYLGKVISSSLGIVVDNLLRIEDHLDIRNKYLSDSQEVMLKYSIIIGIKSKRNNKGKLI